MCLYVVISLLHGATCQSVICDCLAILAYCFIGQLIMENTCMTSNVTTKEGSPRQIRQKRNVSILYAHAAGGLDTPEILEKYRVS